MSTKFVDLSRLTLYDNKIKNHIKKTTPVAITLAEYEERLASYQVDNTYIDPDSGISFVDTVYNVIDDFYSVDSGGYDATKVSYSDNYNLGTKTVQEALDYVVNNKLDQADLDVHTNNTTVHVTADNKTLWNTVSNKADKATQITTTLSASAWTGSTAPYTYALSVSNITTSINVDITYNAETITEEQYNALSDAKIIQAVRSSGKITFTAYGEKPTVNIPIIVTIGGV